MDTLKIAALALLIPFGLVSSEAATAYPEPVEQIDRSGDFRTDKSCSAKRHNQLGINELGTLSDDLSQSGTPLLYPANDLHLHHDRETETDTCRLDLDLIETE